MKFIHDNHENEIVSVLQILKCKELVSLLRNFFSLSVEEKVDIFPTKAF